MNKAQKITLSVMGILVVLLLIGRFSSLIPLILSTGAIVFIILSRKGAKEEGPGMMTKIGEFITKKHTREEMLVYSKRTLQGLLGILAFFSFMTLLTQETSGPFFAMIGVIVIVSTCILIPNYWVRFLCILIVWISFLRSIILRFSFIEITAVVVGAIILVKMICSWNNTTGEKGDSTILKKRLIRIGIISILLSILTTVSGLQIINTNKDIGNSIMGLSFIFLSIGAITIISRIVIFFVEKLQGKDSRVEKI